MKVSTSGIASLVGGACATIVVWVLATWLKVDVPVLVQGAFVTVITFAISEWFPDASDPPPKI